MKSCPGVAGGMLLSAAVLLSAACANQMEPAKRALEGIREVVNETSPDVAKYIPVELANVNVDLAELKFAQRKSDYATVLADAPTVLAGAKQLDRDAAAKKSEAMTALIVEWHTIDESLPPLVAVARARITAIAKIKRVRKDVNLATAQSDLADALMLWDKAEAAFESGAIEDAVTIVKEAKPKAEAAAAAAEPKIGLAASG